MRTRQEIIVGIDGSAGSVSAVQWAAHAAAHERELLAIVHVSDPPNGLWAASRTMGTELRELTRPLVDVAREIAARAEPALPIRSEVLVGQPWRQLAALSAHTGLLVVGRTGRRRALAALLGSTPSRLAVRAHCPLLVVPETAAWPPERVLVAVGSLPEDRGLLRYGADLAASLDVPLRPLHAAERSNPHADLPGVTVIDGWPDRELARWCTTRDLLVVGRRPARAAVQATRYRQILDEARCPVVVLPLAVPVEGAGELAGVAGAVVSRS